MIMALAHDGPRSVHIVYYEMVKKLTCCLALALSGLLVGEQSNGVLTNVSLQLLGLASGLQAYKCEVAVTRANSSGLISLAPANMRDTYDDANGEQA